MKLLAMSTDTDVCMRVQLMQQSFKDEKKVHQGKTTSLSLMSISEAYLIS